jgi:hypothetical protein
MEYIDTNVKGDIITYGNLEEWFLSLPKSKFPGSFDYVGIYRALKAKLEPVQKQVTQGADEKDGTSLTWHDQSHIDMVMIKASELLAYQHAKICPFEAFILLCAIQLHDIMNSVGRDGHEDHSTDILSYLEIPGLIDSMVKKAIGDIVSCHSGSFMRGTSKERDKIGFTLQPIYPLKGEDVQMQFLAAILRLADEYSDNELRAMSYLLSLGKIKEGSEAHHKYAECLHSVRVEKNTGTVKLDFHVQHEDTFKFFNKVNREKETIEPVYIIDEIFTRVMKAYYETMYCMRYMRPFIPITKLAIFIEVVVPDRTRPLNTEIELVEKGYPTENYTILDLCADKLRLNGAHWSGYNIQEYIKKNYY